MGLIAKAASSGLGFASEAIHAARNHSAKEKEKAKEKENSTPPSSTPPPYNEQERSVSGEKAEYPPEKGGAAAQEEEEEEEYVYEEHRFYTEEELRRGDQDEAAWQLDEAARQARPSPPAYEEREYMTMSVDDSEKDKEKKRQAMVEALVRMAGPVTQTPQLPCPVIIPQRRPRFKERGFVRAYAPLLAEKGIKQEVFLQFLESLDKSAEVCIDRHPSIQFHALSVVVVVVVAVGLNTIY